MSYKLNNQNFDVDQLCLAQADTDSETILVELDQSQLLAIEVAIEVALESIKATPNVKRAYSTITRARDVLRREERKITYKIWFQDGSKVQTRGGVDNEIDTKKELLEMAVRFDFDADEVLLHGETEMLDDGQVIGGVYTLK